MASPVGTPNGGSLGGGGTGRRATGSAQRLTWFEWYEAKVGPQRTVTPADGAAPRELTPLEHVRACLRMDEAQADGDERPTLVYFHWPHEHPLHGALVKDMCAKALEGESAARWGRLFRCVQVDMAASDARLVELLGGEGKPGLVVLDAQTQVVARVAATSSSAKLEKGLKDAIQKFPERWKRIQADVADQAKRLEAAKRMAKDDRLAEALSELQRINMSNVRIGEAYDEAATLLPALTERLAREQAAAK